MLYHCRFSIAFWKDFEAYWSVVGDDQIHLTLEDIVVGVITRPCPLLNYILLIAKFTCGTEEETPPFQTSLDLRLKLNLSMKQKHTLHGKVIE